MDIELSDKQVKQFALVVSLNDVLECIKKDIDSYLSFLNNELENEEITDMEYDNEMKLIERLKEEGEIEEEAYENN